MHTDFEPLGNPLMVALYASSSLSPSGLDSHFALVGSSFSLVSYTAARYFYGQNPYQPQGDELQVWVGSADLCQPYIQGKDNGVLPVRPSREVEYQLLRLVK